MSYSQIGSPAAAPFGAFHSLNTDSVASLGLSVVVKFKHPAQVRPPPDPDMRSRGASPMRLGGCEPEQAGRIVDQDAMPQRRIRRDHGQEIQEIAFVGGAARREGVSVR